MNKYGNRFIGISVLIAAISLFGCAKKVEDPLKHTKKLVKEGHASLYNNGSFKVPYSSLRLIPPGPDTMEFVGELAGIRARESFSLSLKKAAESVDVVVEGTKDSYELAKKINKATGKGAKAIRTEIGDRGTILVSKSYRAGKDIAVRSWKFSKEKLQDLNRLAGRTVESFDKRGEKVSEAGKKAGEYIAERSERKGSGISEGAIRKGDEIAEGSIRKGDEIAEGSIRKGNEIAGESIRKGDEISEGSMRAGKEIVKWPIRKGKEFIKESIIKGDEMASGSVRRGDEIAEESIRKGDDIIERHRRSGGELIDSSIASAKDIYKGGEKRSRKALRYGYEQFVQGYASLPSKLKERGSSIGESLTKLNLWEIAKDEWKRAESISKLPEDMVVETISGYAESAAEPFKEAKKQITEGYKTSSLSFSILKSMGLVIKGLLWDATIEPAAKVTAGSLGYIGVNMVAYPSMVVVREGVATVELAAEVTWNTARAAYDIVAPTPIAAVAGVYSLVDFTASNLVAGTTATMGTMAGFGEKRAGEIAGVTVKGAGQIADVGTKVVGQVAGAAVKGAGTVAGAVIIGGGTVGGAATGVSVMGAGQVAGVTTKGVGQLAAITTKGVGQVAAITTKGAGQVAAIITKGAGTLAGLTVKGTGKLAELGVRGAGKVAGLTVKGAGYAGAGLQYIGIPVAAAGITITGGTVGTAIGTAGGITGGTVRIAGETGAAATQVFGNSIAATTLVGGTAISTATGSAIGVYQLSKAVVVPTGHLLGSGIVLSYGTLSHIAAHSILAVSDASYMVLSLEGPRWVLYAVKGDLDGGEDIPAGTILDLKKMQAAGEEIIYLPVSDEGMAVIVESVYENLPEVK